MLSKMGVKGDEVIILSRDAEGTSGASMEDFSVDSLRGVYTSLDHGDTFVENVIDIGAGLGATLLVKIGDRVVVGIGDVVFCPVMLENAMGVFLITVTFRGIFYCCYATE